MNLYKRLSEGGGFNLPYLIHLSSPDKTIDVYLINDNQGLIYKGHKYTASSFSYIPTPDGEATFSIEIVEHDEIIELLEDNHYFKVDVIGVFNGEQVEPIAVYHHKYGEGTWDGAKLEMKLQKDDRGSMTFPALIFNSYNNRGNN